MGMLSALYFLLWKPNMGEHRHDARIEQAADMRAASVALTERNFSKWSYPQEVEFHVQECDEKGKPQGPVMQLTVYVEPVPVFSASQPKPVTAKPQRGV